LSKSKHLSYSFAFNSDGEKFNYLEQCFDETMSFLTKSSEKTEKTTTIQKKELNIDYSKENQFDDQPIHVVGFHNSLNKIVNRE
jgi:hypothetical protein